MPGSYPPFWAISTPLNCCRLNETKCQPGDQPEVSKKYFNLPVPSCWVTPPPQPNHEMQQSVGVTVSHKLVAIGWRPKGAIHPLVRLAHVSCAGLQVLQMDHQACLHHLLNQGGWCTDTHHPPSPGSSVM